MVCNCFLPFTGIGFRWQWFQIRSYKSVLPTRQIRGIWSNSQKWSRKFAQVDCKGEKMDFMQSMEKSSVVCSFCHQIGKIYKINLNYLFLSYFDCWNSLQKNKIIYRKMALITIQKWTRMYLDYKRHAHRYRGILRLKKSKGQIEAIHQMASTLKADAMAKVQANVKTIYSQLDGAIGKQLCCKKLIFHEFGQNWNY